MLLSKNEMTQRWRENNREHYLALSRGYSAKRRKQKEVMNYQNEYLRVWKKENREKVSAYQKKSRLNCIDQIASYQKRYRVALWNEYMDHYGRHCVCCGENEIKFLTIEHLNGDGNIHRKQIGSGSKAAQICDLKKRGWPSGYSVLCFNCNCAKDKNGGICPHQEKINGIIKLCA